MMCRCSTMEVAMTEYAKLIISEDYISVSFDAGNEAYNQYLCKDMCQLFSKPIIQFL